MYPDAADEKRTAFRREEKRYQLHRDQTFLTRRNKKVGGPLVTRRTCVADALDSRDLRFVAEAGGGEHGVRAVALADADRADRESHAGADPNRRAPREAYALACRPGFFIFPGALDVETQREWLAAAVTKLCEPPAETNHDAAHGPIEGLWDAATGDANERWLHPASDVGATRASRWSRSPPANVASSDATRREASSLLRRLRWATLGPKYDWTSRTYRTDEESPCSDVPNDIRARCETLARVAHFVAAAEEAKERGTRTSSPPPPPPPPPRFRFGAGLVNYYRSGDALAGHVDDAERDLTKPIVSFSLGSPCVFLLGGDTRDEAPTPLILRSGDAVVLSRESRRRFHGVPRIFVARENVADARGEILEAPREVGDPECWTERPEVARYVAGGRVNVSVRDID